MSPTYTSKSVFILLALLWALPTGLAQCPVGHHCPIGPAVIQLDSLPRPSNETDGRFVVNPGEVAYLLLNFTAQDASTPRFDVTIQFAQVSGVVWEEGANRSFTYDAKEGSRSEVFPFRVRPEATSGNYSLPLQVTAGEETMTLSVSFIVADFVNGAPRREVSAPAPFVTLGLVGFSIALGRRKA